MKHVQRVEFPPEQRDALSRARRLEWLTLAYLVTSIGVLYLVMGSSQAMKTQWLDDFVSMVAPTAFLVTTWIAARPASPEYPYGHHRAVSIGYLVASLALAGIGLFLLVDSGIKLVGLERATIGGMEIFGTVVWAGWPMLVALAYASVPSFFLGRAKLKLARKIHDKTLYTDAEINRADWMSALAAGGGVLGIGFGFWWADAAVAVLISLDIMRDGYSNIRAALSALTDEMPHKTVEPDEPDLLPAALERELAGLDWIERVAVRMREQGHVYFGEIFVVPASHERLAENLRDLAERARRFHWRVHDVTVMPVRSADLDADLATDKAAP